MDTVTLFSPYYIDMGSIAGDFSCCMDNNLDLHMQNSVLSCQSGCNDAGLADVWREFNATVKDYSFYSARNYSCLDLFLLPQELLSSVTSCNIQGLDNETETPVILVWEVSWLNWTSLVASLH
ncbi:hypothetical protein CRENBAI_002202 [Crenichthys baileyi]|uniref:Uncharacterized protein n=1 Tax=Crenichthys baileyi TaxID=28760 RepID=A0AAV9RH37_9TELE